MDAITTSKENRRVNYAETGPCNSLVEKPFSSLIWLNPGPATTGILELDDSKINQAVTKMLHTDFGGPNLPSLSEPNLTSFPRRLPIFVELSRRFEENNRTELPFADMLVKIPAQNRNTCTVNNIRLHTKHIDSVIFSRNTRPTEISQGIVHTGFGSEFNANNPTTTTNSYAITKSPHTAEVKSVNGQIGKWTTIWPPRVPAAVETSTPFPEAPCSSSVQIKSHFEISAEDYQGWPNLGGTKVPQKEKWPLKKTKDKSAAEYSENSNLQKKIKKPVFRPFV